jgi:hypothetical protein
MTKVVNRFAIAAGAIIFVKKKDEKKNKAADNNAMSDDADADK